MKEKLTFNPEEGKEKQKLNAIPLAESKEQFGQKSRFSREDFSEEQKVVKEAKEMIVKIDSEILENRRKLQEYEDALRELDIKPIVQEIAELEGLIKPVNKLELSIEYQNMRDEYIKLLRDLYEQKTKFEHLLAQAKSADVEKI